MLKGKLKDLVSRKDVGRDSSFEILSDHQASFVLGGADCTKLAVCGTYIGQCSELSACNRFGLTKEELCENYI